MSAASSDHVTVTSSDHVVSISNPLSKPAPRFSSASSLSGKGRDTRSGDDEGRSQSIDLTIRPPAAGGDELEPTTQEASHDKSCFHCCSSAPTTVEHERCFDFATGKMLAEAPAAGESGVDYDGNAIYTNQYQWATFVPVNLLQQFSREANFYFLIIAVLASISIISPSSPVTSIAPLVAVLGVTLAKDGYDDLGRRRADEKVNSTKARVLSDDGSVVTIPWQKVKVGHIVQVEHTALSLPLSLSYLNTQTISASSTQ